MIHIDLFSGIGGFAYAVDQVWPGTEHIFCDNDPFCQQVLAKHWPGSEIHNDIRTLITDTKSGRRRVRVAKDKRPAGSQEYASSDPAGVRQYDTNTNSTRLQKEGPKQQTAGLGRDNIDILTGGFPCQPFSQAGARRGTDDERHLWPEMLEVIRLTKPTWVIAENVGGILTWDEGVVFEQVCSGLEDAGYEVQPLIIPAAAVGAPHRRDRVWFIANTSKPGLQGIKQPGPPRSEAGSPRPTTKQDSHAQNAGSQRGRGRSDGNPARSGREIQDEGSSWGRDWSKVAAELCSVDDGLPVELDGLKLTKSKHRAEQLKAYGNAIVPQVAIEIMEGMKYAATR